MAASDDDMIVFGARSASESSDSCGSSTDSDQSWLDSLGINPQNEHSGVVQVESSH